MNKYFLLISLLGISITAAEKKQSKKSLSIESAQKRLANITITREKILSEQASTQNPSTEQAQAWDFQLDRLSHDATRLRILTYNATHQKPVITTMPAQNSPKKSLLNKMFDKFLQALSD